MTQRFNSDSPHEVPDFQKWKLTIAPCEELEKMEEVNAAKGEIAVLLERLNSAVGYYRWLEFQYQRRAQELCSQEGECDYERSPYDPYGALVCVRCHQYRS